LPNESNRCKAAESLRIADKTEGKSAYRLIRSYLGGS
jgi:hypothetical protein